MPKRLSIPIILFLVGTGVVSGSVSESQLFVPAEDMMQIITTSDGSKLIGRINQVADEEIEFQTELGQLTIPIDKIESIQQVPASSVKRGRYWFPNPNQVRLYIASTARPLKQGKGYVADYMLFAPYVAYGITDNFSLEGGVTLIPGLGFNQVFYYRSRFGFQVNDNVALGGGIYGMFLLGDAYLEFPSFSSIYTAGSFGTPDHSVTLGIGYGVYSDEEIKWMKYPALMLGGEFRVARGVSIVTENYYSFDVFEEGAILSYGLRFFGRAFSVDACFFNLTGEGMFSEAFPGIPFLAVAYNF